MHINKTISDLGYNYRTEPCFEKETWIDIFLDNILLTVDTQVAAKEISTIIEKLINAGIK